MRLSRLFALPPAVVATLAACAAGPDETDPVRQSAQAMAGLEGTFEFALDAPWRMDPIPLPTPITKDLSDDIGKDAVKDPTFRYDPIPLQVSIHDADHVRADHEYKFGYVNGQPSVTVIEPTIGRVCDLTVTEGPSTTVLPLSAFDEVESSNRWLYQYNANVQPDGAVRRSCVRTSTTSCGGEGNLAGTAEWHGLASYVPKVTPKAGLTVALMLELRVTRDAITPCSNTASTANYRLRNWVRVHYGEAPLPRFGAGWAYGDLHYHSQGTDNEGESAYNYRGVSRAMRAVGLDFLWATEHASAARQMTDVDISIGTWPDSPGNEDVEVRVRRDVLRDMDKRRFTAMREVADGANQSARAVGQLGHGATPQIFVGGEIDAIPEARFKGTDRTIPYGAGLSYQVRDLCNGWKGSASDCATWGCNSGVYMCCDVSKVSPSSCPENLLTVSAGDDVYMIRDVQGLNQLEYGREHMVYLPDPDRPDAFVASSTGPYGGATRRLSVYGLGGRGLLPEVQEKSGSVFLAHHLNAPGGSVGPDGPPWSEHMLDQAFASPAVLGLEFWNEDTRLASLVEDVGNTRDSTQWTEDLQLVENARDGLRSDGNGLFELRAPRLAEYGLWDEAPSGVEQQLVHGSYSWDKLNLKGLNPAETSGLAWLPAGEPRRLFMAGGSDAHGDFNYRREGYMVNTTRVIDTAIGTPRNLVMAPQTADGSFAERGVLTALRAGHFSVTDGPALRVAFDWNNNGIIDPGDTEMGDSVSVGDRNTVDVIVEWSSTEEFNKMQKLELVVGVYGADTNGGGATRLYTGGPGFITYSAAPALVSTAADGTQYHRDERGYYTITLPGQGLEGNNVPPMLSKHLSPGIMTGRHVFKLDVARLYAKPGLRTSRMFVRAIGITERALDASGGGTCWVADLLTGRCLRRYALTNPLWVRFTKRIDDVGTKGSLGGL